MTGSIKKVFVSSTIDDLVKYRNSVRKLIDEGLGYEPIMMENFSPDRNSPKDESLKYVRESQVFIGIYARKYGTIPKGESVSLCQLEYQEALRAGIPVCLFVLDSNIEWPKKFCERDSRKTKQLNDFIKSIKEAHVVKTFQDSEDIILEISRVFRSKFDKSTESELKRWQGRLKDVNAERKISVISSLVEEHYRKKITSDELIVSTDLIVNNFKPNSIPDSKLLVSTVGDLVEDNLTVGVFVSKINKLLRKNIFYRLQNRWYGILGLSLILLILVVSSYRYNWFNSRVYYLAGKNNDKIDVIEWLMTKQVEPNIVLNDLRALGTRKALHALRFAYEIDGESEELSNYIQKSIIQQIKMLNRLQEPSYKLLDNNLRVLQEICRTVSFPEACDEAQKLEARVVRLADSLRAVTIEDSLLKSYSNSTVSDTLLLNGFINLNNSYAAYVDTVKTKSMISKLRKSISLFKSQLNFVNRETIPYYETLVSWQRFLDTGVRANPAMNFAQEQISELNKISNNFATIQKPGNIVTCRWVENRQPVEVINTFPPGIVYVWARISAPRNEKITIKWYKNREVFYVKNVSITKSVGFRIYYSKRYHFDNGGMNEVRLYNSKNLLIGRKVFIVESKSITEKL